jgi:hypothetical protein
LVVDGGDNRGLGWVAVAVNHSGWAGDDWWLRGGDHFGLAVVCKWLLADCCYMICYWMVVGVRFWWLAGGK